MMFNFLSSMFSLKKRARKVKVDLSRMLLVMAGRTSAKAFIDAVRLLQDIEKHGKPDYFLISTAHLIKEEDGGYRLVHNLVALGSKEYVRCNDAEIGYAIADEVQAAVNHMREAYYV